MSNKKINLFLYDELQLKNAYPNDYKHLSIIEKDVLEKYKLYSLPPKKHNKLDTVAIKTYSPNDCIEGNIYEVTEQELLKMDENRKLHYKRVLEVFPSGKKAWVYITNKKSEATSISQNIKQIRKRMQKACKKANRSINDVQLLLATKTVNAERIKEAIKCGETLIAENKVQEIKLKHQSLQQIKHEQHFIGHLQTNKINNLLKYNIQCIQSLDRWNLAKKLHNRLERENKTINALIQVNTSAENSKFGVSPEQAIEFATKLSTLDRIRIKGLMTIGLFSSDEIKVRACFKRLKTIQQQIIKANIPNIEMTELSMGMSGDLEIAIEEGSTIIRVGTAIFGARKYPDSYYWDENKTV